MVPYCWSFWHEEANRGDGCWEAGFDLRVKAEEEEELGGCGLGGCCMTPYPLGELSLWLPYPFPPPEEQKRIWKPSTTEFKFAGASQMMSFQTFARAWQPKPSASRRRGWRAIANKFLIKAQMAAASCSGGGRVKLFSACLEEEYSSRSCTESRSAICLQPKKSAVTTSVKRIQYSKGWRP